jgi:hypothetical protein
MVQRCTFRKDTVVAKRAQTFQRAARKRKAAQRAKAAEKLRSAGSDTQEAKAAKPAGA